MAKNMGMGGHFGGGQWARPPNPALKQASSTGA